MIQIYSKMIQVYIFTCFLLSFFLFIYFTLSIYLIIHTYLVIFYLFIYLFVCLFIYVLNYLLTYVFIYLFAYLFHLAINAFIHLFVWLSNYWLHLVRGGGWHARFACLCNCIIRTLVGQVVHIKVYLVFLSDTSEEKINWEVKSIMILSQLPI